MLRQFAIQIPRSQWPEISAFLNTPLQQLEEVVEYLTKAKPLADVEDLAEACAKAVNGSSELVETVLSLSMNLSRLERNLDKSANETLERVADALGRANFPDWETKQSAAWEERKPLLETLIQKDNAIDIMSKARELLYDFQSVFVESAVLTDVRHIYNADATKIEGGLVLHTINLTYFEGTEPRQTHVTLSGSDVEKLIAQLKRSQRKAKVATSMLLKSGIPELTPRKNI